jgi:hypothetical protein
MLLNCGSLWPLRRCVIIAQTVLGGGHTVKLAGLPPRGELAFHAPLPTRADFPPNQDHSLSTDANRCREDRPQDCGYCSQAATFGYLGGETNRQP